MSHFIFNINWLHILVGIEKPVFINMEKKGKYNIQRYEIYFIYFNIKYFFISRDEFVISSGWAGKMLTSLTLFKIMRWDDSIPRDLYLSVLYMEQVETGYISEQDTEPWQLPWDWTSNRDVRIYDGVHLGIVHLALIG